MRMLTLEEIESELAHASDLPDSVTVGEHFSQSFIMTAISRNQKAFAFIDGHVHIRHWDWVEEDGQEVKRMVYTDAETMTIKEFLEALE